MGMLTAGSATGQLIFLPPVAALAETAGWRWASLLVAAAALVAVPIVWAVMRDYPSDRGVLPFGADPATYVAPPRPAKGSALSAARRAIDGLVFASKHRSF